MSRITLKKLSNTLMRLLVTAGCLFLVSLQVDLAEIYNSIRNADITLLLMSILLLMGQIVIVAYRWWFVLRTLNEQHSFGRIFGIYLIGAIANSLFITTVAGLSARILLLRRYGTGFIQASISVGTERLATFGVLLALVVASLPFVLSLLPSEKIASVGHALLFTVSGVLLFLLFVFSLRWVVNNLLQKPKMRDALDSILSLVSRPSVLFVLSIVSLISLAAGFFAAAILAKALGISFNFWGFILLMPIVAFVSSLPISMGGWGVREGAMVFTLHYLDVPSSDAFTLSVLYGLMGLISLFLLWGVHGVSLGWSEIRSLKDEMERSSEGESE